MPRRGGTDYSMEGMDLMDWVDRLTDDYDVLARGLANPDEWANFVLDVLGEAIPGGGTDGQLNALEQALGQFDAAARRAGVSVGLGRELADGERQVVARDSRGRFTSPAAIVARLFVR